MKKCQHCDWGMTSEETVCLNCGSLQTEQTGAVEYIILLAGLLIYALIAAGIFAAVKWLLLVNGINLGWYFNAPYLVIASAGALLLYLILEPKKTVNRDKTRTLDYIKKELTAGKSEKEDLLKKIDGLGEKVSDGRLLNHSKTQLLETIETIEQQMRDLEIFRFQREMNFLIERVNGTIAGRMASNSVFNDELTKIAELRKRIGISTLTTPPKEELKHRLSELERNMSDYLLVRYSENIETEKKADLPVEQTKKYLSPQVKEIIESETLFATYRLESLKELAERNES